MKDIFGTTIKVNDIVVISGRWKYYQVAGDTRDGLLLSVINNPGREFIAGEPHCFEIVGLAKTKFMTRPAEIERQRITLEEIFDRQRKQRTGSGRPHTVAGDSADSVKNIVIRRRAKSL